MHYPAQLQGLAGKLLESEHERASSNEWEAIDKQPLIQLALDGWKRSHCGEGTPLVPTLTARTTVTKGKSVKVKLEDSIMRRGWWQTVGQTEFPHLSKVAVRLLSFHVTAYAAERNWSLWGKVYPNAGAGLRLNGVANSCSSRGIARRLKARQMMR